MSGGETAAYMATGVLAMTALNQVPKLFGNKKTLEDTFKDTVSGLKNSSSEESLNETLNNTNSNQSEKSINPNHDIASLSSDIKNYSEEYGKEQALSKSILYMFL